MAHHKVKKQNASKADRKATRRAARRAARKAASKAASNASSEASRKAASSQAPCYFLRIPIEIRREIYGYLLLDPPQATLARIYSKVEEPIEAMESDDAMYDSLRDDMDDEPYAMDGQLDTSSFDSSHDGDESENEGGHGHGSRVCEKKIYVQEAFDTWAKVKRHLAILRTNRQIYSEASALLHSDLTIEVEPGDTITGITGNSVVLPSRKVWRHASSKGLGFTNTNGQTVYESALLDGTVEPHVFARFEKLSYYAEFEFMFDEAAPTLYINDDDLSVRADDAAKFVSYLTTAKSTTRWVEDPIPGRSFDNGVRETLDDVANVIISSITVFRPSTADILQKFVDLVSKSPLIRHLEVDLDTSVIRESSIEDTDSDYDLETDAAHNAKEDWKDMVCNERATELFLESGVLDRLRQLSNVKCFSLNFATDGREQKHLNIIRELKMAIEKNWVCKHGSRQAI